MDKVALDLGIIQIYWYSILVFIGILVASFIIIRESKRQGISEEFLVNLIFNTIIIGIIGARLYYVLFNLSYYLAHPIEIFTIWNGGLAIHGGLLLALPYVVYYCNKNKVITLKMLDIIVVGLILAQAIGRWGNFFNSEAYGLVTTYEDLQKAGIPKFIIDGMYINVAYHHPTFFYESMWCIFGFIGMLIVRRCKSLKIGQLTSFYLVWYGIERFCVEALRTDSLMIGPIKIAQVVSIIFIILGILIFIKSLKLKNNSYFGPSIIKEQEPQVYFK